MTMKRTLLLLTLALAAALLSVPPAMASSACPLCGNHGCVQGAEGSNSPGCYCTHTAPCRYGGCPCTCDFGDPPLCTCGCSKTLGPPTATSTKIVPTIIKTEPTVESEHEKWVTIFKQDPPGMLELFHAMSSECAKTNAAFIAGATWAAGETGHPIKFVVGTSETDTLQDKIDAHELD